MNRSYSKIRHIQESNLRLERRLISEQVEPKSGLGDIYYQRCEGGDAIIDPESYIVSDVKTKDDKTIIKFIKTPRVGKDVFNNGESDSIGTCLGGDEPLIDRCWSIGNSGGSKIIAWMEVDCSTGEDKY